MAKLKASQVLRVGRIKPTAAIHYPNQPQLPDAVAGFWGCAGAGGTGTGAATPWVPPLATFGNGCNTTPLTLANIEEKKTYHNLQIGHDICFGPLPFQQLNVGPVTSS